MRLTNAILNSKDRLFFCAGSNGDNVIIGQSAIPMISSIVMSAFYCCIQIVFGFCAYLKMVGIYAWRVVALVHNYFAIRYLTYKKLISISMRSNSFAASNHKNSITIFIFSSLPNPTFVGFLNFCFKRLLFCDAQILIQGLKIPSRLVVFSAKLASHRWFGTNHTRNNFVYLMAHKSSCKNLSIFPFHGVGNVV